MSKDGKNKSGRAPERKWMGRIWLYALAGCAAGLALMLIGIRCGLSNFADVALFMVPVLIAGVAFGVRAGRIPGWWFNPKIHLLYRGRAVGTVTEYNQFDSATVAYEAAGRRYSVKVSDEKVERAVTGSDYHPLSDTWSVSVERVYDENRLGPIGVGSELRVRYVPKDPSRAVVLPKQGRR